MIVAITGGTGFIGRKLVLRHVASGDEVRVLSRRAQQDSGLPDSVRHWCGDLSTRPDLRSFVDGAHVVYHCAAEISAEDRMAEVHLDGTAALIQAASGCIGRWVQLSSTGAYGAIRHGVVTEEHALFPSNTYERTKAEADALVSAVTGAFEHVILRPSNVYGADMSNQSLFGLISMVRKGLFFFIGKPGVSANYIHVDNVVSALMQCGSDPRANGKLYNVSDHCLLEEFIGFISNALGKRDVPVVRLPEILVRTFVKIMPKIPLTASRIDALTNRVIYSNSKIESELDYQHVVSMKAGIHELVAAWELQKRAL